MQQGTISVQTENIFPIIKKFLYSDHEIFLRELVSNAVDACQKVNTLSKLGEIPTPADRSRVVVELNQDLKTLTIRDNGIGMTAEEVDKYINQIAFSGAEEFVSKYQDAQIIGHFGLGFYSAFMVAKQVDIHSLSHKPGSESILWSCDGSPNFTLQKGTKTEAGTEIVLHLADDSLEFNDKQRIEGILEKYCKFMPVDIQFGTKTEWIDDASGEVDDKGNVKRVETQVDNIVNNPEPLWMKKPAELTDEQYGEFYRELYPTTFEEPLFHIHVNVDYPFNLTGILFFPRLKNQMDVQKNKVQLYSNQVFITDEVKNILPDFLTMLHGVIDSPDIPLNVSRSYLQEDGNVKKISGHITKKVADKLQSMFAADRADFEQKWDDIGVFIHYGMLTEEKFYDKAKDFALYKTTTDSYYTFTELQTALGEAHKDKKGDTVVLYCTDRREQHSFVEAANERGYQVIELSSPLAVHLISHLERKNTGITFKRVDSDVLDKLIEKDNQLPGALNDEQKGLLKPVLEALIDTKKYSVQFENMSPSEAPFVITQNEFMRRMKEQSMMGGGGFYGAIPESYTIAANTNHPLMEKVLANTDDGKTLAKQALDLALLAKGLLKGEELTAYIKTALGRL